MLPFEILSLLLLASGSSAVPQQHQPSVVNITTSSASNRIVVSVPFIHIESSETGFENILGSSTSIESIESTASQDTPPGILVTIEVPTVIGVHTEIQGSESGHGQSQSAPGPAVESSRDPGGHNGRPGTVPSATGPVSAVPQVTSGNDLLTEIISRIGVPQPGAQPTSPPSPTGASQQFPQQFPQPSSPATGAPSEEPTGTSNEPVTIGTATLTLTPGLSTSVGSTFVTITTNTAGQTIIIVSSSGTAVSATMTRTVVALTRSASQTVFDASLTKAAKPGADASPTRAGAASSASSTGGVGVIWRHPEEWWIIAAMGVAVAL